MINITYLNTRDINKLNRLYGEGHIKALLGRIYWIREDEERYVTVVDIKNHSPQESIPQKQRIKVSSDTAGGKTSEDTSKLCANCGRIKDKHHSYIYCNPFNNKKFTPKSKLSKEEVSEIARKTLEETGYLKPKNHIQCKKDDDLPVGKHLGKQLLSEEDKYTGECLFDEATHADTSSGYSNDIVEPTPEGTHKWKECTGCKFFKAEEDTEAFDFLVCPSCDADLEEFEE